LLPIFEILSPTGKHFEKLKSFVQMKLPEGCPTKIEIPVFPTIVGTASFLRFDPNEVVPDEHFDIPKDYTILI